MRRVLPRAAVLFLVLVFVMLPQTASAVARYEPVTATVPVSGTGTFLIKEATAPDEKAFASITIKESGSFSLRFEEPDDYSYVVFSTDAENTARYKVLAHTTLENGTLQPNVVVMNEATGRKTPAALYPVYEDPPVAKRVTGETPPTDETFEFLFKGVRTTAEGLDGKLPMPEGSEEQVKKLTIVGAGEVEAGVIKFDRAGIYEYEFTEVNTGAAGYRYDSSVYRLTFTVTESESGLRVEKRLTRNGEPSDLPCATFVNEYESRSPFVPKTGDNSRPELWAALLCSSLFGEVILLATGRKRRKDTAKM